MGERRRRRKAQLHIQNSRKHLFRDLRVVMAVVVTATSAGIAAGAGANRTISYTHAAGNDLCVIVLWQGNSVTLSSVTYNGAAMSLIVAAGQGGVDPGPSCSAYRINDPGGMTANLVITYTSAIPGRINAYMLDVAGCPSTSPVEAFGSNANDGSGGADNTCAYTRISSNTLSVIAGSRQRSASALSFTGDNGATELFDEDSGTNPGLVSALYTLQETVSGSLTRGLTTSIQGKQSMLCLSYTTDAGQPFLKRWGGIRFAAGARKGLW